MSPAPLVEGRGLTKRFGSFVAVDAIDFRVEAGETFGFLVASRAAVPFTATETDALRTAAAILGSAVQRLQLQSNYRGIIDNEVVGVCRVAIDGTIVFANAAYARMLGYDSVEQFLAEIGDIRKLSPSVDAFRRTSREIVDGDGPSRRAISRTPTSCARQIEMSSRSRNDR